MENEPKQSGGDSPAAPPAEPKPAKISLRGYLLLNLIVWAFCVFEIFWIRERFRGPDGEVRMEGALLFFVGIGLCFSLVTVYDCIYDRLFLCAKSAPQSLPASDREDLTAG